MERPLIDLSLGVPCYGPPPEAQVAATQAIIRRPSGYLPEAGMPRLREAIAAKLRQANAIEAREDEVVITTGGSLGILASAAAVAVPRDRVLAPSPGYPQYRLATETLGLELVRYPLLPSAGFEPDWEALHSLATDARLLIWNFPSNPTGALARSAWAGRLQSLLEQNPRLILLSDEVYEDIVFGAPHVGAAELLGNLRDRCMSVFSFSKGLGMAGMRVGYVHAPAPLAATVARRQWSIAMSPPTPSQWAALAALSTTSRYRDEIGSLLQENRDMAQGILCEVGLRCDLPEGGFFLWASTEELATSGRDLAAGLETERGVRVSPGTIFDPTAEHRVRISFAVPTELLIEALDRIGAWLTGRRPFSPRTRPVLHGTG